jgi:hypothetical protein
MPDVIIAVPEVNCSNEASVSIVFRRHPITDTSHAKNKNKENFFKGKTAIFNMYCFVKCITALSNSAVPDNRNY